MFDSGVEVPGVMLVDQQAVDTLIKTENQRGLQHQREDALESMLKH